MAKLDLSKILKELYSPSAKVVTAVDVPAMNFLMVDGRGDPNGSQEFQEAIEALYGLSYTLKFGLKKSEGLDWKVMPLEGLWWVPNMAEFSQDRKNEWFWTVMIAQPDFVTESHVRTAAQELKARKNPPALDKVRFEPYHEGPAAQILYIGRYSEEGPTIVRLHEFIAAQGRKLSGKHHEIYLSDMRRTAPDKLKTIIRQPFA